MLIYGLEKSSLLDYPGKIASVIFLAGCNFRCEFCHNSELVLPELIAKQPTISEKKLFDFLKTRTKLLDGIVITGGEPTIHKDLPIFLKKIKKLGFLVKLDTNGTNPAILESLIKERLIDYIAMDIKAPCVVGSDPPQACGGSNPTTQITKYEKITGVKVDIDKVKQSIEIIKNSEIEHEFRTTVIPTFHTKEDIIAIAEYVQPSVLYIQNFENPTNKIIDKNLKEDPTFVLDIYEKLKIMPKIKNIKLRK